MSASKTATSSAVLVVPMTDVDGLMHLVTDLAMNLGRSVGCYRTVCGADVLTASLTAPELRRCRACWEACRG